MILEIVAKTASTGLPVKQEWHLHFHRREAQSTLANGQAAPWDIITTCLVHTGDCLFTQGSLKYCVKGQIGTAKCSRKDQYSRRAGAKLALARAIQSLSQEIRQQIWRAYWLRCRRPKESPQKFAHRLAKTQSTEAL